VSLNYAILATEGPHDQAAVGKARSETTYNRVIKGLPWI
jgi:hypothetical protein